MSNAKRQSKRQSKQGTAMFEELERRQMYSAAAGPVTPPVVGASAPALSVALGTDGISKITFNGATLYNDKTDATDNFRVAAYTTDSNGINSTWTSGVNATTTWNASTQTLTFAFPWGNVATTFTVNASSVEMSAVVTNTSTNITIQGVNVFMPALQFPSAPTGFDGGPAMTYGTSPAVQIADYGTGAVAVVEEDTSFTMYDGYTSSTNSGTTNIFDPAIASAPFSVQPAVWPILNRQILPGASETYHFSLRFGPSGSTIDTLAEDVVSGYAAAHPFSINWTDRRPIGSLYPAGSGTAGRSATNPRGWFDDPTVDVTTQAGLAAFSQRLLAYAASSITELKAMDAQGMITWDIEGEQYPQGVTYIGDPRIATQLAPELNYNDVIDQYFAMFRNAGLEVGVTIRPQQFEFNDGTPIQADINSIPGQVEELVSKIQYAEQRWGCTLFYIDSTNGAESPAVLREVHQRCPSVLLIPENSNVGNYTASASYLELFKGYTTTPTNVQQVYTNAFSVINTALGDVAGNETALVSAVEAGNILLFQGWFNSPNNALVAQIYQLAATGSKPGIVVSAPVVSAPVAPVTVSHAVAATGTFSSTLITDGAEGDSVDPLLVTDVAVLA